MDMDKTRTYDIRPLDDRKQIRAFYYHDRPLSAYALGDLEDHMWEISTFTGAFDGDTLNGVSLVWQGAEKPVLIVIGSLEAADSLMAHTDLPDEVFFMLPAKLLPALATYYNVQSRRDLWRMVVQPADFIAGPRHPGLRQLVSEDAAKVNALFNEPMRAHVVTPELIENGTFYGVEEDGEIIALAGTHIYAESEGVGVIGYVYTAPTARGRGLATAATGAVTRELFGHGIDHVVLNVLQDNSAAVRSYQKLGFRIHAPIVDGIAVRK